MHHPKVIEQAKREIILHESILEILFERKRTISNKLNDIRGFYGLDHVAISIINPNNEMAIFSLTPSVEYNLIIGGLWKFDDAFYPTAYHGKSFVWWDHAYNDNYANELKYVKEKMHHFTLGVNLIRSFEKYNIVYSFATRNRASDLREYYSTIIDQLFRLGDYGYKLIRDTYIQYCKNETPPLIAVEKNTLQIKKHLKLIINNDK